MAKQWAASITIRVPIGMKELNPQTRNYDIQPTTTRTIQITVPDSGGYYNTKCLLEGTYGHGSVNALIER